MAPWFGRGRAQHKALSRLADAGGPLVRYAEQGLPDPATPAAELRLLAIDVETTGLDPATDHLLSVGFVPVDGHAVALSGARRLHVRPPDGVGVSATIHGLTDDLLAQGIPPRAALDAVIEALTGRVLLAHYARLEVGFLAQACRTAYGRELPLRVIDTLELGRRALPAMTQPAPGSLRLWTLRERFGLPVYPAHDALQDALACAELYLAQVAELEARSTRAVSLKTLM